jgi:cation transport regulator ChaB
MITMPVELLKSLPEKARKLYETVYKNAINDGKSPREAAVMAIEIVKKSYKQTKTKEWVAKSNALKLVIVKSGLFNNTIKFKIPLTNTKRDSEGERVTQEVIDKIVKNKLYNVTGDLEHERIAKQKGLMGLRARLTPYVNTETLFLLEDIDNKDGELEATVVLNKLHPLAKQVLEDQKKGKYLFASSEFFGAKYNDNDDMIDVDSFGWTISNDPINAGTLMKEVIAG